MQCLRCTSNIMEPLRFRRTKVISTRLMVDSKPDIFAPKLVQVANAAIDSLRSVITLDAIHSKVSELYFVHGGQSSNDVQTEVAALAARVVKRYPVRLLLILP